MVLWLLVLLGAIAASHAHNVQVETRLAHNQMELAQARALVEAGVNRAIMELLVRGDVPRRRVDGTVYSVEINGQMVSFSIRDADGLVDLNAAQPALLETLLGAAGVDESRRTELVDAILDWRDADDLRHLHGAENNEYRHAGLAWHVRNGPFASIDELRYVIGMTGALYRLLSPYLTVYSGYGGVKPEFAPAWLAKALNPGDDTATTPPPADITPDTAANIAGGVYHIVARAGDKAGTRATAEAVVRIVPAGETPYTILSWREPAPGRFDTNADQIGGQALP